jgi:hypothetical protein
MDKHQEEVDKVLQVVEDSEEYVEKFFSCLPDEMTPQRYAAVMLSALHFTALIGQLDKEMSKKTFLKLNEEAWKYILQRNKKAKLREELASGEVVH